MTSQFHPCPTPEYLTAEQAEAYLAAQHAACEREAAAARERAEVADAAAPGGASAEAPRQGFGRGWIPAGRDIGLPGEDFAAGGDGAFLPGTGRGSTAGGGGAPSDDPDGAGEHGPGVPLDHAEHGPDVPLHHASHGPPPPVGEETRTWRSIDFTPARRAVFLHHLAQDGNVRTACSRVPVSPQAAYLARRRDPLFRAGWDAALVQSREYALQVLANRALDGVREEVWHRGELVGHRVRHDARLLLAHLGRLDARCQDARALRHADRFDELLALVAGEDYGWGLCDVAGDAGRAGSGKGGAADCDDVLPITRAHHSNRAASLAFNDGAYDEPVELDHDELIARAAAEAEWDEWGARVDAVNDALEAGKEPAVAAPDGAEDDADRDEPPFEVKSLDGLRGAGPGYLARTVSRPSTWSGAAMRRERGSRGDAGARSGRVWLGACASSAGVAPAAG